MCIYFCVVLLWQPHEFFFNSNYLFSNITYLSHIIYIQYMYVIICNTYCMRTILYGSHAMF